MGSWGGRPQEELTQFPSPSVRNVALEGEEVVEVAAGVNCTAVVTASGKAVTFGRVCGDTEGMVREAVE